MDVFLYKLIKPPHQIRMLELLPGEAGEPIHIRLNHYTLHDMSKCEALSYEWGSPTRDQSIFCEGRSLKVTPNLLAALYQMRHRKAKWLSLKRVQLPDRPRLLWIDAICINQDDVKERSQQVKLMTHIYRTASKVLVWIGGEQALTREAFDVIRDLATACTLIKLDDNDLDGSVDEFIPWVEKSLAIKNGMTLEKLAQDPIWPCITDLLAFRTYFTRLWTVQEIAMSSARKTRVICGSISCEWLVFYKAARLLFGCEFLQDTIPSLTILQNIVKQYGIQNRLQRGSLNLWTCIELTKDYSVSEIRDRIFALLGMLDKDEQGVLARVDYTSSPELVFRAATEILVLKGQHLKHMNMMNFTAQGKRETNVQSWVLRPDPQQVFGVMDIRSDLSSNIPITIEGAILSARGIILDTVSEAFQNLSQANLKTEVLAAYQRLQILRTPTSHGAKISILAEILLGYDDERMFDRQDFICCILKWLIEDLGMNQNSEHEERTTEHQASNHPALVSTFLSGLSDKNHNISATLPQNGESQLRSLLQLQLDQISLANPDNARNNMELFACRVVGHHPAYLTNNQGRNIFASRKRFWGMGPMADNRPGNMWPAVQVGDQIAILAGVNIAIILRPDSDSCYTFVGPAQIAFLQDEPCFQPSNLNKSLIEIIRIR